MDIFTQNFPQALRKLRTARKLTQEELALRAGVDYKYLQKLESRKPSSPTLATLGKLAHGLDMTLIELVASIPAP